MNKKAIFFAILALTLASCASDSTFREGERLLAQGRTEEGLRQLEQAAREEPNNVQYRTAYIQAREAHINRLLTQADTLLQAGRDDEAEARYRDVLKLQAEDGRARTGLQSVETARSNRLLLKEAREALDKGESEFARSKLRAVLAREPKQTEALSLMKQVDEKSGKPQGAEFPKLAATYRRPVTLRFRDAPVRTIFDALSSQSGLNFVFDSAVRSDARLSIFATDTPIIDALDMLLQTGQLAKKVLNDNTLLIYPAVSAKLKEYQDLVVKGFFLSNTEAKQAVNLVRSMVKTKDIYVDETLNMLVVRDTPEAMRLVEKLLAMADRPLPEVMLEVEILEVKRTRLQELGLQWPNQLSVLARETQTQVLGAGTPTASSVDTKVNAPLTIELLKHISGSDIAVGPTPTANLRKDTGDVNILANPRIRVKNKEKANIHIGDKVPVITSNVTSTGVTSESVSYLDVGLKVEVEPQIYLEGEVGIKVGLEVSNIVQQVKSAAGTLAYQLGSRNANTVLRLKDGETQVLAGLISDEDRAGASKVPGFGDIPLLGRLFSSKRDELSKTEIVLLITPHIIRNIERPELAQSEFFGGTETNISDQPLRLQPATTVSTPGGTVVAPVPISTLPQQPPRPRSRGFMRLPGGAPGGALPPESNLVEPDEIEEPPLPEEPNQITQPAKQK